MKKTSSSVSREPRKPAFLWLFVRETAAILLDVQRLLCFWAELQSIVALLTPTSWWCAAWTRSGAPHLSLEREPECEGWVRGSLQ